MSLMEPSSTSVPYEDTFKIMVATDLHLGYNETDPIRGDDSFIAFEEILELAVENDVDFILLGGDLFDDPNPSQNSLHKCITLLRRYTLGDKPIEIEILSDQSLNFTESLSKGVNYEDPNINVSIPVFSIHGNHDDPSGFGGLSSLDLLAVSGLVNYFGKWVDLQQINITPILMKKGVSHLALYGLSHIHDNRLFRLFRESKIVMHKPDETKSSGDWFNMMVLHQNRADRGLKNYIPEKILPDFLNLIIWGHEHDCRILPEKNIDNDFHVIQPGSSVATSLSEGESLPKHCGLLLIHENRFQLKELLLKTVRPFVFESINMADYVVEYGLDEIDASEKVMEIAKKKVEEMIEKAKNKLSGDRRQPQLPLIRLRIFYTHESQTFHPIRFGQQFNEQIANPKDVVLLKRATKKNKVEKKEFDKVKMDEVLNQEDIDHETRVEEVVDRYFEEVDETKKLQLMSSKILSEMCYRLVERNDDNAADSIIKFYKEKTTEFLLENLPGENDFEECVAKFRGKSETMYGEVLKMLDERGTTKKTKSSFSVLDDESEPENNVNDNNGDIDSEDGGIEKNQKPLKKGNTKTVNESTSTRGTRGRGRGRGSRGGGGTRQNKTSSTSKDQSVMDMITKSRQSRTKKPAPVYTISDSD